VPGQEVQSVELAQAESTQAEQVQGLPVLDGRLDWQL
jgi:hypothetical protein